MPATSASGFRRPFDTKDRRSSGPATGRRRRRHGTPGQQRAAWASNRTTAPSRGGSPSRTSRAGRAPRPCGESEPHPSRSPSRRNSGRASRRRRRSRRSRCGPSRRSRCRALRGRSPLPSLRAQPQQSDPGPRSAGRERSGRELKGGGCRTWRRARAQTADWRSNCAAWGAIRQGFEQVTGRTGEAAGEWR